MISSGRRERGRVSIPVVMTRGNGSWGKESSAVRRAMYSVCVGGGGGGGGEGGGGGGGGYSVV